MPSSDQDSRGDRPAAATLRLAERRFHALIAYSPMSTQIYAPDGTTLLVNRAWEDLWGVRLLEIGDYNILHDPQLIALGIMPQIARGFAGEPTTLPPIRYDPANSIVGIGAGRVRWVRAVIYPVKDDADRVREVVVQYEDVTERVQARHLLEERVASRTEELTTLLEVARLLSSTLELGPLLDLILNQLGRVVPCTGAAIWLIDDDHLVMAADQAPEGQALPPGLRIPTTRSWWADTSPRPAIVADVQDERDQSPAAVSYRTAVSGRFGYSRAWLRIPLIHRDRPIGMLSLSHEQPGYYTPHHAELAQAISSQAAAAIENARLYARAQETAALERSVAERTRELASLLDVTHTLTATLELEPLLQLILEQLARVVEYHGASILALHGGERDGELILLASRSPAAPANATATVGLHFPLSELGAIWETLGRGESLTIPDILGDSLAARGYRRATGQPLQETFSIVRSWLGMPLIHQGRITGLLTVSWPEPEHFTERDATLATAFASQAAVAIENARLYAQAQETAALEERQRLARELHDSVTQALFSATLHARAAQLALERAGLPLEGQVGRSIGQLRTLTQGALAEMRALIFELRPGALAEEGLAAALTKHAAALAAREGLEVEVHVPAERLPLDPAVEEHLYRLAQEALHNVVKHAHAIHAQVRLVPVGSAVVLEITDDGIGFDSTIARPGHLGLGTMADRARAVGAALVVESILAQGTIVRATVPEALAAGANGR